MGTKGRLNIINRDEYPVFKNSPTMDFKTKHRITGVHLKMIDQDARYEKLKKAGRRVDITNPEIFVNGNQKPDDGIFSPIFGSDTTQDKPFYSCECQALTGASHLGEICKSCHKPVVAVTDGDLRTTMFIDIAPYHILTFIGYKAFCKLFGDKKMEEIITSVKKIDRKGKIVDDGIPTIMALYNDYEDEYEPSIKIDKKYVFMTKIPVYSARLRPLMTYGMNMTLLEPNKRYLSIVKNRGILATAPLFKVSRKTEVQNTLNQIQQDFNAIVANIETRVNTKEGVFRKSLASGRIDYTSRMVISLGIDLMPNEIDVPYQTMMVIYEEEIANILSKVDNISITEAISMIQANTMAKSDKFVNIINQLLKAKNGIWAMINRNPTISESSILYVRVRKIHDDGTDITMHMPPDILSLLAADFGKLYLTI